MTSLRYHDVVALPWRCCVTMTSLLYVTTLRWGRRRYDDLIRFSKGCSGVKAFLVSLRSCSNVRVYLRPAERSGEERYISFCFRYVFAGGSHKAGVSPWRAIGWFNTMTTGKRRQAANRVQSQLNSARWSRLLCWRKGRQLPQTKLQPD